MSGTGTHAGSSGVNHELGHWHDMTELQKERTQRLHKTLPNAPKHYTLCLETQVKKFWTK